MIQLGGKNPFGDLQKVGLERTVWNRGAWGAETLALTTNFILFSFEKWHSRAAGDRRKYRKVRQGEKRMDTKGLSWLFQKPMQDVGY